MKKTHLLGAVCALFVCLSAPVNAATVVTDGGVATSIQNLFIDSIQYNVTFTAKSSFDGVFGTGSPSTTFWGDQTGAEAAVTAINNELNTFNSGNIDLVGIGTGANEFENDYLVPFTFSSGSIVASARGNNGFTVANVWGSLATFEKERAESTVVWAEFTVVPVPAAAWLFGSALGLLGWMRRRVT